MTSQLESTPPLETTQMLPPRGKFHLYLLIGQSNMAGGGLFDEEAEVPNPRVFKFTKDGSWAPGVDPLHVDRNPEKGVGLGTTFGRMMADANPEIAVGLIPCAVNGTPLSRWSQGGDLFDQAVERAGAAMKDGELKGILWHQGERESHEEETASSYGKRLADMVRDLRVRLGGGDVPFIAGKLGPFVRKSQLNGADRYGFAWLVNEQIDTLPSRVLNCAVVESIGLSHVGDHLHFDSSALREFGKRYARTLLQMTSP